MRDLFEKIKENRGPIGRYAKESDGYFAFPKLEGEIGNKMIFRGKERLVWSLNNYLGLANHPEVRKTDKEASEKYGLSLPMGARMMSGNSTYHEQLENELAEFVKKPAGLLVNYGYQGVFSAIEALVDRHDVIVYDSESHACIVDGVRLHIGKRFAFQHNDMRSFEAMLQRASKITEETGGGILVITEGVFGMRGDHGKLKEIVAFKKRYQFRLFVDDAHGIGVEGTTGAGTGELLGCQNEIDVYFGTFAKSFALIGGFLASTPDIIEYLRFNMRSQVYAKSVPMPIVIGALKRLELIRKHPEYREKLWTITHAIQNGFKKAGFDIGNTESCVTPVYMKGSLGEATNIVVELREKHNIFCSIVVYPIIPKGMMILRIIPTAVHTLEDVDYTIKCFIRIKEKLERGEFQSEEIAAIN